MKNPLHAYIERIRSVETEARVMIGGYIEERAETSTEPVLEVIDMDAIRLTVTLAVGDKHYATRSIISNDAIEDATFDIVELHKERAKLEILDALVDELKTGNLFIGSFRE